MIKYLISASLLCNTASAPNTSKKYRHTKEQQQYEQEYLTQATRTEYHTKRNKHTQKLQQEPSSTKQIEAQPAFSASVLTTLQAMLEPGATLTITNTQAAKPQAIPQPKTTQTQLKTVEQKTREKAKKQANKSIKALTQAHPPSHSSQHTEPTSTQPAKSVLAQYLEQTKLLMHHDPYNSPHGQILNTDLSQPPIAISAENTDFDALDAMTTLTAATQGTHDKQEQLTKASLREEKRYTETELNHILSVAIKLAQATQAPLGPTPYNATMPQAAAQSIPQVATLTYMPQQTSMQTVLQLPHQNQVFTILPAQVPIVPLASFSQPITAQTAPPPQTCSTQLQIHQFYHTKAMLLKDIKPAITFNAFMAMILLAIQPTVNSINTFKVKLEHLASYQGSALAIAHKYIHLLEILHKIHDPILYTTDIHNLAYLPVFLHFLCVLRDVSIRAFKLTLREIGFHYLKMIHTYTLSNPPTIIIDHSLIAEYDSILAKLMAFETAYHGYVASTKTS